MNLLEQVGQSIAARKLFARGQRLLVAVSGGVDSMVLLHLLHRLAPKHGWRLTVAHFNHQLRGRSSEADERLVCATAKKLGLPIVVGCGDVRAVASAKKISTEMAARELRHAFLARTARRQKIARVALAHHADDQVELFFLRLLRGSGPEGLRGMGDVALSPADKTAIVVRPLLGVAKSELTAIANENNIRFREDASNASPDFLRNRIRGELLPLLRKHYQPALDKMILQTMEIIRTESVFVGAAAHCTQEPFADLPFALQRRIVQRQLIAAGIEPGFDLIEWLRANPNRAVTISPRVSVACDAEGKLQIGKPLAPVKSSSRQASVAVKTSGDVHFGGTEFSWKIERLRVFRRPTPVMGRELFDADLVGRQIILRHWLAGDRFQPIGMKSAVKLQDLFVNAKIPAARRARLVVAATAGGKIFWVEGLRMGEKFKLSAETKRRLRWEWRKAG